MIMLNMFLRKNSPFDNCWLQITCFFANGNNTKPSKLYSAIAPALFQINRQERCDNALVARLCLSDQTCPGS